MEGIIKARKLDEINKRINTDKESKSLNIEPWRAAVRTLGRRIRKNGSQDKTVFWRLKGFHQERVEATRRNKLRAARPPKLIRLSTGCKGRRRGEGLVGGGCLLGREGWELQGKWHEGSSFSPVTKGEALYRATL